MVTPSRHVLLYICVNAQTVILPDKATHVLLHACVTEQTVILPSKATRVFKLTIVIIRGKTRGVLFIRIFLVGVVNMKPFLTFVLLIFLALLDGSMSDPRIFETSTGSGGGSLGSSIFFTAEISLLIICSRNWPSGSYQMRPRNIEPEVDQSKYW